MIRIDDIYTHPMDKTDEAKHIPKHHPDVINHKPINSKYRDPRKNMKGVLN